MLCTVFLLSERKETIAGLVEMLSCVSSLDKFAHLPFDVRHYVSLSTALLVIEIAKRAEDKLEWFPYGKWATIQAIQNRTEELLEQLTWKGE